MFICTYDIYVYGWMYYWALCLSTFIEINKSTLKKGLTVKSMYYYSYMGKSPGSWHKKIWVLRKNLVWVLIHVISGLLIQTLRGADTKPPGCCYKNHRGPMPGVSGIQPKISPAFPRQWIYRPVADFTDPSLHFQRPRPIFMVTGPRKNDGKLFEHVIGGTLEK